LPIYHFILLLQILILDLFFKCFDVPFFAELGRVTLVLTEEQKLGLSTQRRNSTSDQNSSEISLMKSTSVTSGNSVSDEIVISRSEWDSLQCELDKLRALMGLGLDVDVVGSDQFKELQAQLQESRAKAEKQTKREETLQSEMEVSTYIFLI
jgi:hypothetical protein